MWIRLSNLIPAVLKKAGIESQVKDSLVCREFDKIAAVILGDLGSHCHAVYLKNRELHVAVLSSSVSSELKLYEQDILKALADKFGSGRVERLRFLN